MLTIPKVPSTLEDAGPVIGKPLSRVDGPAKVTGDAQYAAEFSVPNLLHGYVVNSAIAAGHITSIDISAALAAPGVVHVFTHENRPSLAWFDNKWKDEDSLPGSPFRPLYDNRIQFSLQPIALVVAETLEAARAASYLVEVTYESAKPETNLRAAKHRAHTPKSGKGGFQPPPKPRGDAERAYADAPVKIFAEYHQPTEHHNPMEMHASTVVYEEDGSLTVYDKTQGCQNVQKYITNVFNLPAAEVRVMNPFVGGAFGSGLRPQHQLFLAVLAATELKRSVRLELTRPQMFSFGHRPEVIQTLKLACDNDGKLQSVMHEALSETSRHEDYQEIVVNWSGELYQCPAARLDYKVASLDLPTPLDMRAPGAVTGVFAFESAVDELAHAAKIDPLEFRLRNYAETDQNSGKPYSSKALREAYHQGAEKFGWSRRNPVPGSVRDGRHLVGYGMATGIWDAMQGQASAKARLSIDGRLHVGSATADIGTGTYTVMTQIAAESLGLHPSQVSFRLGDSTLPMSPLEGGSWTVSSVGSAVKLACDEVGKELLEHARKIKDSPFARAKFEDVKFENGFMGLRSDASVRLSIQDAMRAGGVLFIEQQSRSLPNYAKQRNFTSRTHSAVFVEVRVDEALGTVGVSRVVSAIAAGRIINPKTARSQVLGAVVWGIGMALEEETFIDYTLGRYINHDLAEYHVPVCADIGEIDVIFVEEHDDVVNPLGAKGVGEIGIVGVAAAVSNAVFNATGKRIRSLPITLDKLLRA